MHSQAIVGVMADELCQQHELYSAIRSAPLYTHSQSAPWEQVLKDASKHGAVGRVRVLPPEDVVHRCYTVYQSCVYEAIARGQECELAGDRLLLHGQSDKLQFVLRLGSQKKLPSIDSALANYRELASAHRMSEQEKSEAHIQLDEAIATRLAYILKHDVQRYAKKSSFAFHQTAQRMAETCVQEIGKIILGALGTTLPAYADFLGILHWSGEGDKVTFTPSKVMVDMLKIPAMRKARASRRGAALRNE